MIQDLLAFSRIGSTKENFEFISFKKNIKNTLSNIDLFLEENKVIIEYENNFPEVYCNSNQICQVLQNLIINAVKYKKDEKPRINIGYKKDKGQYIFYVKDNGSGIDSKYHEKIFIIFKRLSSYDDKKGTGIGLALCKKVIENHGGEIWVRSKINQGSTFYFTIPFKEK